nr:hypothetical protein [Tanacetum cinerariifolium]
DEDRPIDGNIIGKVFDTPDDAYTFYNQYAFTHGFGIRKHWDYKNKMTNEVYRKWYVCNKEGFKTVKDDGTSADTKKRRRDLRTGCEARLRITITKDGRWCVDFFDDTACKSLMLELGQSGMRPCHVKKAVNAMKPPYVVDVTSKQCSDILFYLSKENNTKRKYWVWSFLKDGFFAGMTTSGRSESIHSFFDGFVNSNTMLNEFVIQYDKAVNSRRAAEEDEDFKTMNSRVILSSVHPIEAKAGKCYTRKIFEKFKKEWKEATNNLSHSTLSKSLEHVTYSVGQLNVEKKCWRTVNFSLLNKVDVTCSCDMFETYGILCKHILFKVGNHSIGIKEVNDESEVSALTLWLKKTQKGQNRIKTGQKREAWRSREKSKAVTVDRARKTEENIKRSAENANTVKSYSSFKRKKKRKGLKVHFHES